MVKRWEGYRDASQFCMGEVREAKMQLKLNLARDGKRNKRIATGVSARNEAQRKPHSGNIQGQLAWSSEQPVPVKDIPDHARVVGLLEGW